jgi:hypothetical protein
LLIARDRGAAYSRPTFGPAPPIMRGAWLYSSDFPLRGALLRNLWPVVVEALKADDHDET